MAHAAVIHNAAASFRAMLDALDRRDKLSLPIGFRDFPHGSCDPASQVLGRYLRDKLTIEPLTTVHGERVFPGGGRLLWTHRWLESDGLAIDVTADQFGQEPIVVTRRSRWHQSFQNIKFEALTDDEVWWSENCALVLARFMKYAQG